MNQLTLFDAPQSGNAFSEICSALACEYTTPGWPDAFGRSVAKHLKSSGVNKIRTLSLFSGAGGLDIGFSDVGFEIVESVEIESKFCETLEINSGEGKRFENSKVNCIDIREFSGAHLGKIDFIIGGPPCQTFSAAGRRANGVLGTSDARGVLFREYVRLLEELSPVGFLFENVYGIIGAQGGKPWQEILDSFSEVGYKLYYRIVDAKYGKPYLRDELEELRDKILTAPGVRVAGFVCDADVDRRDDVVRRAVEIADETGVDIQLLSFREWIDWQTEQLRPSQKNRLADAWLIAVTESFAQRRLEIAPIDEPCDGWLSDLLRMLQ